MEKYRDHFRAALRRCPPKNRTIRTAERHPRRLQAARNASCKKACAEVTKSDHLPGKGIQGRPFALVRKRPVETSMINLLRFFFFPRGDTKTSRRRPSLTAPENLPNPEVPLMKRRFAPPFCCYPCSLMQGRLGSSRPIAATSAERPPSRG